MTSRTGIRFLVCDDHAVVRRGVSQIIQDAFQQPVIGEVQNAKEMFLQLKAGKWDILILDYRLPDRNGLDVLKEIKESCPRLPVLALSAYPEEEYAIRFIKAGASGYLTKECIPAELVQAIQKILEGKRYITSALAELIAASLPQDRNPHRLLSDREYEIMTMIASGKSASEIANLLHLSIQTVSTYRSRLFRKMGMKSNAELIRYVLDHHLS